MFGSKILSLRRSAFAVVLCLLIITIMTSKHHSPVSAAAESLAANPLLERWTGPYGGVPPFDKVKVADLKPALEAAMTENLAEIDAIARSTEPANFENTIAALERSGQTLRRVSTVYGIWTDNMSDDAVQAVESEMAPKLAAFSDKITQNEALFKRIEAVYNSPDKAKLTPEQQRLVWDYYTDFVRSGAKLAPEQKKRLSEINQQLAGHFTKFSQNQLGDESELYVALENDADLAGLPPGLRDAAAQAATAKKVKA